MYLLSRQQLSTTSSYVLACLRGSLPLSARLCHGLGTDEGRVGGGGLVYVLLTEAGHVEGLLLLGPILAPEQHVVLVEAL